jgi:hypothetical protein
MPWHTDFYHTRFFAAIQIYRPIRVAKKLMSRVSAVWLSQKPNVIGTIETENVAFDNDEVLHFNYPGAVRGC